MNFTKAESLQSIEAAMRTLKLGGLAKEWRNVEYHDSEQYMRELLEIEVKEREANRMTRMIKQAGFRVMKTLDDFVWKPGIEVPASITREEIESAAFVAEKENLVLMGVNGFVWYRQNALSNSYCSKPLQTRSSCSLLHSYRPCQYTHSKTSARYVSQLYDIFAKSGAFRYWTK